jgi:hypothetical protein
MAHACQKRPNLHTNSSNKLLYHNVYKVVRKTVELFLFIVSIDYFFIAPKIIEEYIKKPEKFSKWTDIIYDAEYSKSCTLPPEYI